MNNQLKIGTFVEGDKIRVCRNPLVRRDLHGKTGEILSWVVGEWYRIGIGKEIILLSATKKEFERANDVSYRVI
jgi:hypothetical protein